jgi:CubicO group peptidase (beta-lactamase class C family)
MDRQLMTVLGLVSLMLPVAPAGQQKAVPPEESLSTYMARKIGELNLAGAGIGVIHPDGTTWVEGFGQADLDKGVRASADTVAMWASSSKVVTGAAVMKAMQEKGVGLDAPVNASLPFTVVNPNFPQTPVTFRMLLTHTSSILFDTTTGSSLYVDGDATIPLGEFLREYLVPAGRYYKPTNYATSAPGRTWVYSNINASLLGYLVERITGTAFNEYCRAALFAPLGMREAGWFLRDVDLSHVAIQYRAAQASGTSRRVAHYGWPGYPDGLLRCSARDMLRMMAAFLGAAGIDGTPVLTRQTLAEMFTPQGVDPAQLKGRSPIVSLDHGLVWRLIDVDGRRIWSHNGNGSGMATALFLDDNTKSAAVVWISGGVLETPAGQAFFVDLHHRLLAEMERIRLAGH